MTTDLNARIQSTRREIRTIMRMIPHATDFDIWCRAHDRVRELRRTLDKLEQQKKEGRS